MDTTREYLSEIRFALPQGISFFHMGYLQLRDSAVEAANLRALDFFDSNVVFFRLSCDSREKDVLMLLSFDKGLPGTTYSEVGNLIICKIASRLTENHFGLETFEVSPPLTVDGERLRKVLDYDGPVIRSRYTHVVGSQLLPIGILMIPAPKIIGGSA